MNNSNFIYVGNVKIKIGKQKYNYRNSGTEYLFQMLARCLCGLFPSINELPNYLQFRGIKSDEPREENLLINPVKVHKEYQHDDNPQCIITSTISRTDLRTDISNPLPYENYEFQLLNSNKSDAESFATIAVVDGADLLGSIQTGNQAYIEWSLSIGNETKAQQDKETT